MSVAIEINHLNLFARSSLNITSDICAICREHVCDSCIKCQQKTDKSQKNINEQCYGVMGICNHAYHHCCIKEWTKNLSSVSHKCPMCNGKWDLKKRSINRKVDNNFIPKSNINKSDSDTENHLPNQNNQVVHDNSDSDSNSDYDSEPEPINTQHNQPNQPNQSNQPNQPNQHNQPDQPNQQHNLIEVSDDDVDDDDDEHISNEEDTVINHQQIIIK